MIAAPDTELSVWLHENRGCGAECAKCRCTLERSFRTLNRETRATLVECLCSYSVDGLEADLHVLHERDDPPVLWILPLLTSGEYRLFLDSMSSRAPFDAADAWRIVHVSWANIVCFPSVTFYHPQYVRDPSVSLNFFHWHPPLAPCLIESLLRDAPTDSGILSIIGYFRPVAHHYPHLAKLLPKWNEESRKRAAAEEERRKKAAKGWRIAEEERETRRLEEEKKLAQRIAEIESLGLIEALNQIIAGWPESTVLFIPSWLELPPQEFDALPGELVEGLELTFQRLPRESPWKKLLRQIKHRRRLQHYAKRSRDREQLIQDLTQLPIVQRLRVLAASKWPLTYYPEQWAGAALSELGNIPLQLAIQIANRCDRLRSQGPWLTYRNGLIAAHDIDLS